MGKCRPQDSDEIETTIDEIIMGVKLLHSAALVAATFLADIQGASRVAEGETMENHRMVFPCLIGTSYGKE